MKGQDTVEGYCRRMSDVERCVLSLEPGAGRTEKLYMFAGDGLERKAKFGRKNKG